MNDSLLDEEIPVGDNVPFLPISIKWGAIGSIVTVGVLILGIITGLNGGMGSTNGTGIVMSFIIIVLNWTVVVVLYVLLYYFSIKEYRTKLGGYISFLQGLKVAWFSALVKAIIYVICAVIIFTFIFPDYSEIILDEMKQQYEDTGMDAQTTEEMMTTLGMFASPYFSVAQTFLVTLFGGLILSLIAAAIGQRQRPIS